MVKRDRKRIIKKNYEIIPQETEGLFKVINLDNHKAYKVDINKPFCSCDRFKYTKKDKRGHKKICGHIKLCRGVR